MKRPAFLQRSATAHLCWAICGAVCWTVTGSPALSQTFDDLTATITEDGSCYVLHIENRLAGALLTGNYTIAAPITISLDVVRGSGDVPEQIRITTDDSYFADPADLVLPDKASADVLVCQRVGA